MEKNISQITIEKLKNILFDRCKKKARVILAIAGPPASGKSTLAKNISEYFNLKQKSFASILPLDGFHYDDTYLVPAGLRDRKGAIQTFDFGGFYHTVKRLYDRNEKEVAVPIFDRKIEIARAGARIINSDIPLIIVEGNYLLINLYPWSKLKSFFDVKIFLNIPKKILHKRSFDRWYNLKKSEIKLSKKLHENDINNGEFIFDKSHGADYLIVET